MRTDGLSENSMNVSHGGAIFDMISTHMKEVGYHTTTLHTGEE